MVKGKRKAHNADFILIAAGDTPPLFLNPLNLFRALRGSEYNIFIQPAAKRCPFHGRAVFLNPLFIFPLEQSFCFMV